MIRKPFTTMRVTSDPEGPSMTAQEYKKECDINNIMKKYSKTGAISHLAKYGAQYGMATSASFHDAMSLVASANSMFEELPANIKDKFRHDPGAFFDFVNDPKNLEEARELGLAEKDVSQLKYVDSEGLDVTDKVLAERATEDQAARS